MGNGSTNTLPRLPSAISVQHRENVLLVEVLDRARSTKIHAQACELSHYHAEPGPWIQPALLALTNTSPGERKMASPLVGDWGQRERDEGRREVGVHECMDGLHSGTQLNKQRDTRSSLIVVFRHVISTRLEDA